MPAIAGSKQRDGSEKMSLVNNIVGNVAAHIVLRERGRALSNPRGLICARWSSESRRRMMLIR